MSATAKELADTLMDAIDSIGFEIGRRAANMLSSHMPDARVQAMVRQAAQAVLIDYFLGQFKTAGYVIALDGQSITCVHCGLTSYNINDVQQLYCGHCKRFHIDARPPT